MMMESKKELIKKYNEGLLEDVAIYNLSAFDTMIISEADEDHVFGYYQYQEHEKKFFKLKLYPTGETNLFYRNGHSFDLNDFMRTKF